MNLEDLVDENGLQQDEWSLTRPKFGDDGQLTVVGWSGRTRQLTKLYILKCNQCSKDEGLFSGGYFRAKKTHLINMNSLPCGCSKSYNWSLEQYKTMCSRKADELGYKFISFQGQWKGAYSKIKMLCEKHGEWDTGTINNLVNNSKGCPGCRTDCISEANTKPDDVMIASFFASGAFHADTKFWRSEREIKQGYKTYWHVHCPECGRTGEAFSGNLQKGKRPCACSNQRQQECYINWLMDEHNNTVAIKFGIARDSKQRIKQQNSKSVYEVYQHSVYSFLDAASCKAAERECKQRLECGIVIRRDMPDGWTETTWAYNLDKIIEIYERNGGVRQENH